ncbi:MAG: cyclopropane fatty acyl phospholipid synthase [Gammaproteobacteria bacterium]|nr:cyclopropane fatty acyl phospholipid synthase [Gammaproteobacteria bacterium]
MSFRRIITTTLERAGITIDGDRPWDVQVLRRRFFRRAARGNLGLGEAYVDNDWDVESLDAMFRRVIAAGLGHSYIARLNRMLLQARARLSNLQSRRRSSAVIENHYDLDHRLYEQFLGPWNQYTCCFFVDTDELEEAEVNKLDLICEKLEIKAGDRVLDIGCGWGGFARYAATTRGCHVTGVSLSGEQVEYAREFTSGLPVEIIQSDYRDLPNVLHEQYDKILICGMIEHVGYKNYRSIADVVHELLKDEGLFLLHTIGNSENTTVTDPWIERYIFRNSMIPSMLQLVQSFTGKFVVHDWENYGHYYSKTLSAWHENFERNWGRIKALKTAHRFDEKFRRMWNYYLLTSKAAFDVEDLQLWQIVMSKMGMRDSVYSRVTMHG